MSQNAGLNIYFQVQTALKVSEVLSTGSHARSRMLVAAKVNGGDNQNNQDFSRERMVSRAALDRPQV